MRLRNVDSYTDPATEITYGLRGDPTDFSLAQKYNHDHVAAVTRVLMTAGLASPEVSGFGYTLAGGLSLSVAAGQAFDAGGAFYETITDPEGQPTVVTLDQADATHPRIDLVYILLEPSVQAVALPRTFRRLRTPSELAANVEPYTPTNITRFAEVHAQATVRVHKGVPGAVPAVPALNANEVALYQVRVNANAATLVAGNVTDVRQQARSLAQAWAQIDTNTSKLNASTSAATANTLAQRDGNGDISHRRITSTVATGTSPLVVSSQTEVANLNANMVQGQNLAALDTRYLNASGDTATGKLILQALGFALRLVNTLTATISVNDSVIIANPNAAGGAQVLTLPSAASGSCVFFIKKGDNSANTVTIQRAGTDVIDGATSLVLNNNYGYAILFNDGGANWFILSKS